MWRPIIRLDERWSVVASRLICWIWRSIIASLLVFKEKVVVETEHLCFLTSVLIERKDLIEVEHRRFLPHFKLKEKRQMLVLIEEERHCFLPLL